MESSLDRRIGIRDLRPGDEGAIRELWARLTPESRYRRVLSTMATLSDPMLRVLAPVDNVRRLALVAEYDAPQGAEIVGLANLAGIDDRHAEIGLLIRDDWQAQRIGTALAARILAAAAGRGYSRFVAHLLLGNVAMERMIKNLGAIVSARITGGVLELVFVPRVIEASAGSARRSAGGRPPEAPRP